MGVMKPRESWPPEGRLVEEARERLDISQNEAAKRAGMSGTRWRQIVYGEASGGPGIKNPVRGNAETIAKMARAVKVSAEQLAEAGRQDAGDEVVKLLREELGYPETSAESPQMVAVTDDPQLRRIIEAWPRLHGFQRNAVYGVLESFLREPTDTTSKPAYTDERRTG